MWPFRKKNSENTDHNVPAEVQEYYQAERRERVGIAWLLAGATLIVTIIVILGLFFGGRWVWNRIVDGGASNDTAQNGTSGEQQNEGGQDQGGEDSDAGQSVPSSTTTPTPTPTPSPTPAATPTPAPTQTGATTPATGPTRGESLPATGPSFDL